MLLGIETHEGHGQIPTENGLEPQYSGDTKLSVYMVA